MPSKPRQLIAKIVTAILFGLLILSFAIWGIGDVFRATTGGTTIIEAGPVEIDQRVFERELSRNVNQLSAQFGGQVDRRQILSFGVADQVLAQLVGRAVIDAEAEDVGLLVTDDQVTKILTAEDAFGDGRGGFNRAAFDNYLYRIQQSEEEYLANLRRQILRANITGALTGGLETPEQLARAIFSFRQEKRVVQYFRIDYKSFADQVAAPDEATLASYYEERKSAFMAPETRAVTYVAIDPEELAAETAVSDEAIKEAYEQRLQEFATPEKRRVEQLLFSDQAAAQAAYEKLGDGNDLAALGSELNLGAPVDLGSLTRAELESVSPALAEAAFAAGAGSVAAPVESALGWHLIKVLEVEPGKQPTLDELKDRLKADIARGEAVEGAISLANRLDDELGGGATVEEAGARLNLEIRKLPAVDREGKDAEGKEIADLPPGGAFLNVVFDTPAGEDSLLNESEDGGYFVLRVDGITESAPRPLEEVRDEVIAQWRGERQRELARAKAQQLADRLAGTATLETVAASESLELKTSEPLLRDSGGPSADPARSLPPLIFDAKLGDVVIADASDYLLLAKVAEIQAADPAAAAEAFEQLKERLANGRQDDLFTLLLDDLRRKFDATVNQRLVDETLARF